jgi:hypothetical protein
MTRSLYEVIERIITPGAVPQERRWRVAMTIARPRQASGATAPMLGSDNKTAHTSRKWGQTKRPAPGPRWKGVHAMDASGGHRRRVGQIAAV